ncbi:facilitated trehalose transporter Tret1-like [Periplaneta americana]|uniref:facilitated trehalose transporter Tret1-like n=1 Tax=Periplaneta americana TaxID=6978 RepID=UPI0037E847D0
MVIVISTCVGAMAFGMSTSHTVILIPHLQEENSTLFVDEQTGSFIASMYSIASPIGSLGGGVFMDIWGRRKAIMLGQIGYIIGWATIAGAQNVGMLIIGRTFDGLARGIILAIGPVSTAQTRFVNQQPRLLQEKNEEAVEVHSAKPSEEGDKAKIDTK